MSLDLFKQFARSHPELATNVMNNKTSWQKLYELFEMYGEMIKNVDLESVQKGVNNLQKTIGLLQDIGIGTTVKEPKYEPRPMYKYFDD